jgi:CubicO group peptidase (beta-lactamase class C family)
LTLVEIKQYFWVSLEPPFSFQELENNSFLTTAYESYLNDVEARMNLDRVDPEEVGMNSGRLAGIRQVMQSYVDNGKITGLSTLLARKGKVVHFEQVGVMDRESAVPLADDAIFRIYSMTKSITCTALMTLYEKGCFQLDDPVSKYLPAFDRMKVLETGLQGNNTQVDPAIPITILHLLTHTAGLTYDFLEDSPVCEMYREARLFNRADRSLEELVSELARLPLAFQPGSIWHYSMAMDVLGHLVEILSDKPFRQVLEDTIFKPLEMSDTAFFVPRDKQSRIVTMYGLPDCGEQSMTLSRLLEAWNSGFNEKIDVSATYPDSNQSSFERGGHGLFSTIGDYMKYFQMLLNGGTLNGNRILGRKTIDLMFMNHLPLSLLPFKVADPPDYGYGFGLGSRVLLNVAESQKPGSVGEYGWAGVGKTYFWVDPVEEIIGILMAQSMMQFDTPERELQVTAYAAVDE